MCNKNKSPLFFARLIHKTTADPQKMRVKWIYNKNERKPQKWPQKNAT